MLKTKLVLISGKYIRDAQMFCGREEVDDIHDSEDWADVHGHIVVGSIHYNTDKMLEKEMGKFQKLYPAFTLIFYSV